jgi:hypothetical protein
MLSVRGMLAASFHETCIIESLNYAALQTCTYAAIISWKGSIAVEIMQKLVPTLNIFPPIRCHKKTTLFFMLYQLGGSVVMLSGSDASFRCKQIAKVILAYFYFPILNLKVERWKYGKWFTNYITFKKNSNVFMQHRHFVMTKIMQQKS